MNNKDALPIVIRILGALGGFLGGGLIGIILLVLTNATFGFKSIWPEALIFAGLGGCLGFIFPQIGKKLADIFNYFP